MTLPLPRTALELQTQGRRLILHCASCEHGQFVDVETIILTFGADFDVLGNMAEVRAQLYCPSCGASRPAIYLWLKLEEKAALRDQHQEDDRRRA